jgi:hypothetical protein
MRGTRSSVMGKIIAVAARQDKVIESSNAEGTPCPRAVNADSDTNLR